MSLSNNQQNKKFIVLKIRGNKHYEKTELCSSIQARDLHMVGSIGSMNQETIKGHN
jgi:hypothetical protein